MYLIELLRFLIDLGLLELYYLIYLSLSIGYGMLVFYKLKSFEISGPLFGLVLSFLSKRQLRVFLDGKSLQEYSINAAVLQGSILGPTLFLLYINDLPDNAICNVAIYADDTTL